LIELTPRNDTLAIQGDVNAKVGKVAQSVAVDGVSSQ